MGRFGRRLIYGGHVISIARALSFNGLADAFHVAAINAGRHAAPLFARRDRLAWSEVLARLSCRGASMSVRYGWHGATKDRPCADFPLTVGEDDDPAVILDSITGS